MMGDDLYGMLYGNLDPKKKLLTAVSCSMIDTVSQLVNQKNVDINSQLMLQNGNTALHVSAQKGSYHVMKVLLEARANPDVSNNFGLTPLAMALRNGQEKCVRLLLSTGGKLSDPMIIWKSVQMNELYTWIGYTPDVIQIMLIATPDFTKTGTDTVDKLYHTFLHTVQSPALLKTFFLTGNGLTKEQFDMLLNQVENMPDVELAHWVKTHYKKVHSLQHLTRVAIRRQLNPNAFYGSKLLPIPSRLQDFLIFEDMSLDGMMW